MQTENKHTLPGLKEKRYQQKKDIIRDLYRFETLSKPEICRLTNMTTPTISKIIDELIEEGWVLDQGQGASIGGKRPHIFALNPDASLRAFAPVVSKILLHQAQTRHSRRRIRAQEVSRKL